jgi:hypothetical protein
MSDAPRDPSWWQASDGKWYPPQGVQPPPVPTRQGSGCLKVGLIVLAVLAVLGIGALVLFAAFINEVAEEIDRRTGEADPAHYDVELTECGTDALGFGEATGRITNTSDQSRAFEIIVQFRDPGGDQIGRTSAYIDRLDPGDSARWSTSSFEDAPDDVQCEVRRVNYSLFGGD